MFTPKRFYIAGVQFRSADDKEALKSVQEGQELDLTPEPENKFDPNAVAIGWSYIPGEGWFFGYVPKKHSAEISAALDAGIKLSCTVIKTNFSGKPWEWCEVEIAEVVNEKEIGE